MPLIDTELVIPRQPFETATFSFDTVILENAVGEQTTTPRRLEYFLSVEFSNFVLGCGNDFDYLRDFYISTAEGNLNSFYYKSTVESNVASFDVDAYQAPADSFIVGKYGVLFRIDIESYLPLVVYHVGINDDFQIRGFKTIRKVDTSNFSIRNITTNTQVTGFTANVDSSGRIQMPPGTSINHQFRWTGDYYHVMRFDSPLNASPVRGNSKYFEVSGLRLLEVPTTASRAFNADDFIRLPRTFNPPNHGVPSFVYDWNNKR
ncbi:MAG: hypothetical protein ACRDBG_27850, partial [Waterburya sp.]